MGVPDTSGLDRMLLTIVPAIAVLAFTVGRYVAPSVPIPVATLAKPCECREPAPPPPPVGGLWIPKGDADRIVTAAESTLVMEAKSTTIPGTVKEWFRVDPQRQLPICAAAAVAAALEAVCWRQTGQRFDVSSQAVWIAGKRANPACSCRSGCHHYNCIFGVAQWGAASATEWPQPWVCRDRVPADDDRIWTTGKRLRITSYRNVSTYDDVRTVLDNGGAVVTSVDVNSSLRARVVEDFKPGGPAHAWALMCPVNLQDANGRYYVWGVDPQGADRCRDVSPKSVQAMLDLDGYGIAIEAVEVMP